jgi:hypothetical protein
MQTMLSKIENYTIEWLERIVAISEAYTRVSEPIPDSIPAPIPEPQNTSARLEFLNTVIPHLKSEVERLEKQSNDDPNSIKLFTLMQTNYIKLENQRNELLHVAEGLKVGVSPDKKNN